MQLDSVLTVAIGRNRSNGDPLDNYLWTEFQGAISAILQEHGTLVAATSGEGVGSDDENEGKPEDTAVFVAINVRNLPQVRRSVAATLQTFGQSSAAFALDTAHEPVFAATVNGFRPQAPAPVYDPTVSDKPRQVFGPGHYLVRN